MKDAPLTMTVALQRSPLDARRGVVRLHPQVLGMLGAKPWDPLMIEGSRVTGALAAEAGPLVPRSTILMDDLVCSNAGTSPGETVRIARAEPRPATEVSIGGSGEEGAQLDPFAIRFALLGKIVVPGDRVSLLPQDFSRPEGVGPDLETLVRYLSLNYGDDWQNAVFDVLDTSPPGLCHITMETIVMWQGSGLHESVATSDSATPLVTATGATPMTADLPGLEEVTGRLREILDLGLNHRDLLRQLGSRPQMGILVTGPPGSGKVAAVAAVAAEVDARLVKVWGPALARMEPGEAERALRNAVTQAHSLTPSVFLVEDVEAIAPRDEPGPLFSVLLEEISSRLRTGTIAIICTTAHPESTHHDLRRAGALEHEIEVVMPNRPQREAILRILTKSFPLADDVILATVAARTPGFVAADLITLCREASLRAAQRAISLGTTQGPASVAMSDLVAALEVVKPSSLEGIAVLVDDVELADVGDMEVTKKELEEAVIWPLKYPDTFERLGVEPPRGLLLYGPPGCGKTFLVKAIANSADANFMAVKGAELLSKWVGESERGVRELFRRARSASPTLVFFDEIDALAPVRGGHDSQVTDRVVAQLLTELDGIEGMRNVFVLGATNRPDLIDPAMLRPGRLERLVYVPPPDASARSAILRAATSRMPLGPDIDLDALASGCEGYSAADLAALARAAAMIAMRENIHAPAVVAEHFARAAESVRPSLKGDQVDRLARFAASRGALDTSS